MDPPYGGKCDRTQVYESPDWTPEYFDRVIKVINLCNLNTNYVLACFTSYELSKAYHDVLLKNNFKDAEEIVWYKPDAINDGGKRFVSSVERILFGYRGSRYQATWNFPPDPYDRQNLISFKSISTAEQCKYPKTK